jgi:hypothetical protein
MFLFSLTWVACGADLNTIIKESRFLSQADKNRALGAVYEKFPNHRLYPYPIRGERKKHSYFDELIHVALGWKPMAFVPCNKKKACSTYEELERLFNEIKRICHAARYDLEDGRTVFIVAIKEDSVKGVFLKKYLILLFE